MQQLEDEKQQGTKTGNQVGILLGAKLCPPPCEPMDRSLLDSSVHGISQAGILEWVAISSSRGSS